MKRFSRICLMAMLGFTVAIAGCIFEGDEGDTVTGPNETRPSCEEMAMSVFPSIGEDGWVYLAVNIYGPGGGVDSIVTWGDGATSHYAGLNFSASHQYLCVAEDEAGSGNYGRTYEGAIVATEQKVNGCSIPGTFSVIPCPDAN